jgi:deferrochelatase/peroxidase EfeB
VGTPVLDLADVQGLIVRGYAMPVARHLLLRIDDPAAGRSLLGSLADGDAAGLSVTSGAPWEVKPDCCLNVSLPAAGLRALGVAAESLASFPAEFTAGAAARAERVGDVGTSGPQFWLPAFTDPGFHLLVSLFGQSAAAVDGVTGRLTARWTPGLTELARLDAAVLDGRVSHFGYADGISQPTIAGAPPTGVPDGMPVAPTGEFLLGHPGQHAGFTYPVPSPPVLGGNGSFAAVRVLAQDVDAFAALLAGQSAATGLPEELIAAKFCGRWRNGTPLVLSPDTDSPDPPLAPEQLNDFDYVPGDERGLACPVGAHIRRMYPRNSRVAGSGGHLHRIVRRGLTYGPAYDPGHPHDGIERGLLGMFIGVSLRDQFEFLMAEWANDGLFAPGLGGARDPVIGANDAGPGTFTVPGAAGRTVLSGLPRLVTTRGGAYCFLPSLPALRYLAAGR